MNTYQILGLLSPIVSALGYIPYVRAMVRREIQPHPISWLLWSILGFVTLVTYIGVGAHDTLPIAVLNCIGPCVIFLFTIKYWKGGFTRFDYLCLTFSLVSILIYIVFHRATVALTINLVGDFFAALPTIRKTWLDPRSENSWAWLAFTIGALLSLLTMGERWSYGVAVLLVYLFVYQGCMYMLILRGGLKKHL